MRSDAKASSAGPTMHRTGRLGVLSLVVAVFALLLVASSAFASKQVINYVGGGSGGKGGELSNARDIAVNTSGTGPANPGDFYVVEEGNDRVSRFDEDGNFISAWGSNVLTSPVTEVQKLTVSATTGTYKLSFEGATTADIPFDAGAGEVRVALQELPTMGASGLSSVGVSGAGPFTISFEGFSSNSSLVATDVAQIGVDTSSLTGTASVETTTQGSGQFELCTVAASCRRGAATGGANVGDNTKNGSLSRPSSIAVDGDTGDVYVADTYNRRINEYSGDGTFIRSFGWGVDASTPGEGYEVCPAADRCTYGIAGSGVGQLGQNRFVPLGMAISPPDGNPSTGTVYLADPENRRIDTFGLDGAGPSSIGSSAQFEENQPRKVAVDSRGIVYASNSKNSGEIERYDSEDANGGGVGFLAPIARPPLLEGPFEEATKGLAVDADSDGAGPEKDVLYVLRGSWSSGSVVQQFGPVNEPGLTTPPTAVDDTHGGEAGFGTFGTSGLGFDEGSGHIFLSGASRVYILGEAPAPAATLDPVTVHDAHSATFTGTVDPNGALTGYHFEYVDDANFQATGFANASRVPLKDVSVGNGESPVSVEAPTPHHLVPGTLYHVRLVAKRTFYASEAISAQQIFTTENAVPVIDGIDASVPGTEEATLLGAIERSGQAVTDYHFEWGTTQSYGNSTPAGSLPAGSEPTAVYGELSGLTAGQTYHYRLRATNASGTTTSLDQTFTTPSGPPRFPQRGYEIASQYPTGGVPIVEVTGWETASEDGNALAVSAGTPLTQSTLPPLPDDPHDESVGGPLQYVFSRGSGSWQHRTESGLGGLGWSGDLQRMLTATYTDGPGSGYLYEDVRVSPDDQNQSRDVYERQPDGKLAWLSRDPRIPAGTPQHAAIGTTSGEREADLADPIGSFTMSTDGRTVVFKSQRQLLDADTTPPPSGGAPPFRLYKWEDGQLSFIGVRPDGSVPKDGSSLGGDELRDARYAVSRDGSRVVFSARRQDDGNTAIYVQTDGQPTVEATKEEGVPPLPADQPYNVTYRGAAADDSRVFFTSDSRFTPDSGASATQDTSFNPGDADLYVYDVEANKLRDLTPRLDGLEDPSVDPAKADRAHVLGVAANSEDGKRAYFVAEGRYPTAPNPQGDLPSASGRNLYMAELDSIDGPVKLRFIATLGAEDESDWALSWFPSNVSASHSNNGKPALASSDGSTLGFASTDGLTGQPLGGTEQLYVYDARSGTLDCASCPSDGTLPADDVNKYFRGAGESVADWQGIESGVRRWVSSDGSVFFTTSTALLPADQNTATDVYEFREGGVRLITTGQKGATDSVLSNASVDGSTVFFNTREALAPQDKEPGIPKIYAARVGGGFPYVPPPAPCDFNAGACEGPPSIAPQTSGAGTAVFQGPGNPKPKHKKKRHPKKKSHAKRHNHRTAKHNRRAGR